MKRIATTLLLALLIGGALYVPSAEAHPSSGANCRQCHSFSNQLPVANAGLDQTVSSGAKVTLNGSLSTDTDDGIAAWAWTRTAGTAVTLSNSNTVTASFTAPVVTTRTTITFQLKVTDHLPQSDTDTCSITVQPAGTTNQVPVANAGLDQAATPGTKVTLNGTASKDPDGTISSYAWSQTSGTTVAITNGTLASASFIAPQVSVATNLVFGLLVKDSSGATATDSITVKVSPSGTGGTGSTGGTPVGTPPIADAGLDQTVQTGSLNTLSGFYSKDSDGSIASYSWTQTGGPAVTLSDPKAASPVFKAPLSPATLTFRLTVTDNSGSQDDDACSVVIVSAASTGTSGGTTTQPPPTTPTTPTDSSDDHEYDD